MVEISPEALHTASPEVYERTLLLVDDEDNIRSSLVRLLRSGGYRILTAESAKKGLELLAENEVGVILSDQRMPEMTGVEFLRRVKELYPQTIRIVLSGYTELKSVTDAINEGAIYKFFTKPWDDDLLCANIEEAFYRFEMVRDNIRLQEEVRRINAELSLKNAELERLVQDKTEEIFHNLNILQISQEILENLPVAVIGMDETGMIAIVNHQAEEIFNAEHHEAMLGCQASGLLQRILSDSRVQGEYRGHPIHIELPDGRCGNVSWQHMGKLSRSKGTVIVVSAGNGGDDAG